MTEDDAKTKWCPAVRMVTETSITFPMTTREDRVGDQPQGAVTRCIGSGCMAWRRSSQANASIGYCGLAGLDPVGS